MRYNTNLIHEAFPVDGTRRCVLGDLRDFANIDNDFNGVNGKDFLWDKARDAGFETNVDYVISEVGKIDDLEEAVKMFFDLWMQNDYYYESYSVGVIKKAGTIIALSIVVVTSC